jgi:CubicO group peptidase (beta-lactamase class C family)
MNLIHNQSKTTRSRPAQQRISFILIVLLICCATAYGLPSDQRSEINRLMGILYGHGQFNGAILVARRGTILYRKAYGKANFQTGSDLAPDTPSKIGSVTKQFTAMSIMILEERKKLTYDDPVSKYITEFSRSAHFSKITLRHLLTHTSGMPDYGDLGIDDSRLEQRGLIAALLNKEGSFAALGLKYRYSNPGYALLAIVVERVSGKRFGEFLEQEIFQPVGMSSTFLYDTPKRKIPQVALGYDQFGGIDDGGPTAIPGDGGIYSTVDDLFKWDQVLYTARLVRQSTLSEAFTPGRVKEGTSSYGFGWNVEELGGSKYLWHTGSQAGFRAFIGRRLADRLTIIMLTNKGNSKRQDINTAIQNILADKPYVVPKQSGAETLYKVIHESGIQTALQRYDILNNEKSADYDLGESELNTLGYQLLYGDKRVSDAVAIFSLNAKEHPTSSNAFDSLGEAYWRNGQKSLAISTYQSALKLDPTNGHAASMLKELQ